MWKSEKYVKCKKMLIEKVRCEKGKIKHKLLKNHLAFWVKAEDVEFGQIKKWKGEISKTVLLEKKMMLHEQKQKYSFIGSF